MAVMAWLPAIVFLLFLGSLIGTQGYGLVRPELLGADLEHLAASSEGTLIDA